MLQTELDFLRTQLHCIVHGLLANSSTREAGLNYISQILARNNKRKQLQANERLIAGKVEIILDKWMHSGKPKFNLKKKVDY